MENVEIKGKSEKSSKSVKNEDGEIVRKPRKKEEKALSVVESDRSEADAFLKSRIKKMSKEEKETAIKFMKQRNEARVKARMEPAYSEEDMALYK